MKNNTFGININRWNFIFGSMQGSMLLLMSILIFIVEHFLIKNVVSSFNLIYEIFLNGVFLLPIITFVVVILCVLYVALTQIKTKKIFKLTLLFFYILIILLLLFVTIEIAQHKAILSFVYAYFGLPTIIINILLIIMFHRWDELNRYKIEHIRIEDKNILKFLLVSYFYYIILITPIPFLLTLFC